MVRVLYNNDFNDWKIIIIRNELLKVVAVKMSYINQREWRDEPLELKIIKYQDV